MSSRNYRPADKKITAVAMLCATLLFVGCENRLESAKKLWQENNQDQAISKIQEELTKNPGNAEATKLLEVYKLELVKKLWQGNKQEQAISKLKEELTKNPSNAVAAQLLEAYQTKVEQQNLEKIAKEILEAKVAGQAEGMVKLVDFEKTNGIMQNFNGMQFYTLEYSATVEFQQEAWKECDPFRGCFGDFHFRNVAPSGMEAAVLPFKHFDAGTKVKTSGKMSFQKTEEGWREN